MCSSFGPSAVLHIEIMLAMVVLVVDADLAPYHLAHPLPLMHPIETETLTATTNTLLPVTDRRDALDTPQFQQIRPTIRYTSRCMVFCVCSWHASIWYSIPINSKQY
jgi:hypothetical protein